MASKIIQQKKNQLAQLQNELKRTKAICFKVMNKTTEYKASNGKTLAEMEQELAAIKEALDIPPDDNDSNIITVFQSKINKKEKKMKAWNAGIQELREEIQQYQDAIDKKLKKIPPPLDDLTKNGKILVDTTGKEITLQETKDEVKGSLAKYKLEIEKLKAFVLNLKLGFESMTKNAMKQLQEELRNRLQQEIDKLNKQKAKVNSLKQERDQLKKEYDEFLFRHS